MFSTLRVSVECYDPKTNRWTMVPPMSTRRKHLGCAVFNNMIYAVGGRDDCTELSSAERYSPATKQWSPIVAMSSRRSGVSMERDGGRRRDGRGGGQETTGREIRRRGGPSIQSRARVLKGKWKRDVMFNFLYFIMKCW